MKKLLPLLIVLLVGASRLRAGAETEDLAAAVAAGKVSITFRGKGSSSGDSILATIATTAKAGGGDLVMTVATGTRLQSENASAQNMVIANVKGEMMSGTSYSPSREIQASATPKTFVFEAYCMNFEKNNPSAKTGFRLGRVDPILACILNEGSSLKVKQAAVWIYTDKASYSHVNQKFPVSQADWATAAAIVKKCSAK